MSGMCRGFASERRGWLYLNLTSSSTHSSSALDLLIKPLRDQRNFGNRDLIVKNGWPRSSFWSRTGKVAAPDKQQFLTCRYPRALTCLTSSRKYRLPAGPVGERSLECHC